MIKFPTISNNNIPKQTTPVQQKKEEKSSLERQPKTDAFVRTADRYVDDGIFAYDPSSRTVADECRLRMYMRSGLADDSLQVRSMNPEGNEPQLKRFSNYFSLGMPRFNKNKGTYFYLCENLKDMPDMNGVRGKMPLSGKKDALSFRLSKIKGCGIKTIIDLRSEGECSKAALDVMDNLGIEYVNFPIEDKNWTKDSLGKITEYINAVNKGHFYVGCANGESRTDIGVAINYLFNPKAKSIPEFYFGSPSTSQVSLKDNVSRIYALISENPDVVKDWGWQNFETFTSSFSKKFEKVLLTLSHS